jgi:hypothetical protein
MSRTRSVYFAAAVMVLAAVTAVTTVAVAVTPRAAVRRCIPVGGTPAKKIKNVEAIIDDSYSMRNSDPDSLRTGGLELFISDADNAKKTLGVVEFGTDASTVFAPATIQGSRNTMASLLRARIKGDNGDTNYDSGFIKAGQDNPGAEARIFVTDGADDGGFSNTHRGGPRTFVVGLGIGRPSPSNPAAKRLQQIADETGGLYFPSVQAATLQPTYKTISAAINCTPKPRVFRSHIFKKREQRSTRTVRIDKTTKKIELALNWAKSKNRFALARVELLGKRGRVLASLSGKGKPRKLRTTKARGKNFRTLTFRKTARATRLRFTVKPTKLVRRERTITLLTERD